MKTGGDDRIRTCEGLLTLNGLANRRLQPLGHISAMSKSYSKPGGNKVKNRGFRTGSCFRISARVGRTRQSLFFAFSLRALEAELFNSYYCAAALEQDCVAPDAVHLSDALAAADFAKAA